MASKHRSFSTLLAQKADLKMRGIRTRIFRRHSRLTVVERVPESRRLMDDQDPPEQSAGPDERFGSPYEGQSEQRSAGVQDGAHIFALRHLSRALTTLERGILRLEHLGLYIDAFGMRKIWHQLLTDLVRASGIGYEAAARDLDGQETRAQQLDLALDDVGMALVMAEATMARWSWVEVVGELRKDVEGLYERFGQRMPSSEDSVPV